MKLGYIRLDIITLIGLKQIKHMKIIKLLITFLAIVLLIFMIKGMLIGAMIFFWILKISFVVGLVLAVFFIAAFLGNRNKN